jgi:hypothetical protein
MISFPLGALQVGSLIWGALAILADFMSASGTLVVVCIVVAVVTQFVAYGVATTSQVRKVN